MTSKKRLVLSVDQNKLILPQSLIPENVTSFLYEQYEDGRIVLSPLPASSEGSLPISASQKANQSQPSFSNVIDFRESRLRLKNQTQRNKKASETAEAQATSKTSLDLEGGFVKLCLFSSRLEAEMLGEILKQADIPYLIQSEDIGIFGPGAAPAPGGARIVVRKADFEYAKRTLSGLI